MSFPVALSSMISAEFPEIELTTRITSDLADWAVGTHKEFLRPMKKNPGMQKVLFVDRSFEEMFSFPLIRGTFFSHPEQVVITRRFARTLANDIDSLIGKVLWLRFSHSLFKDQEAIVAPIEIGGIVETPPRNSSLDFEILLPLSMSKTFLDREEGEWNWPLYIHTLHPSGRRCKYRGHGEKAHGTHPKAVLLQLAMGFGGLSG